MHVPISLCSWWWRDDPLKLLSLYLSCCAVLCDSALSEDSFSCSGTFFFYDWGFCFCFLRFQYNLIIFSFPFLPPNSYVPPTLLSFKLIVSFSVGVGVVVDGGVWMCIPKHINTPCSVTQLVLDTQVVALSPGRLQLSIPWRPVLPCLGLRGQSSPAFSPH